MLTAESIREIKEKAARYPRRKSAILPALTVAYRQLGYVDNNVYRAISEVINVPEVEIAEAATFYTMFPKEPTGRYLIQVCHNISCALVGADSLIGYLEKKLGIKKGQTTTDKKFTLISVECLGSCATAPMMQINHDFYENLNPEKVDKILDELRAKS
jgi:NADH-quinone oxidoreductase subunit E